MKRNAFHELEDKIMRDHPHPGEEMDRNVLKNITLFVHISHIAELYIPRFMGMLVDMAGAKTNDLNDPNTGVNELK